MPRSRTVIALAAVMFGAGLLTYAVFGNPLDPFDDRQFSSKRWKSNDEVARAHMAKSAVEQASAGMSKSQVEAMFGVPESSDTNEDGGGKKLPGVETWEWRLGSWSTYGYDDAFFYVSFNSAGKVIDAQVTGY